MSKDEEIYELEQRIQELERKTRTLPYTVLALMLAVLYCVCVQYKINDHFKNKIQSVSHSVETRVDHAK